MILLTGTSGFIGSRLLIEFIKLYGKENVLVLSSKENEICRTILYKNHDLNSIDFSHSLFNKIKTVVHVGAFIPKSNADLNDILKSNSNIIFTQNLLLLLPETVEKFIFFSTVDVYEKSQQIISEHNATIPETLYGFSKLYCEKMVEHWATANKKIIQILRLGHVYGPGEGLFKKIIPITMQKLIGNKQPIIIGDGTAKRGFIYIDDLIFCIKKIMEFETFKGPINIVNDNQISINELVNEIIKISKKDISPEYVSHQMEQRNVTFDATKLKSLINLAYTPLHVGLTMEWDSITNQTN